MKPLNYIKVSLRTLVLHRGFSLLTLVGLSVGIAMGIMVLQYVVYQTSYDEHYAHPEDIFRVTSKGHLSDEKLQAAVVPIVAGTRLRQLPGVEALTRLAPVSERLVKSAFHEAYEPNMVFADSAFFMVFNRPFVAGSSEVCQPDTSCAYISASTAQRFFGARDPLGRLLHIDDTTAFVVKGVFADVPPNSHFTFDVVLPWARVEQRMKKHYGKGYPDALNRWFFLSGYAYFRKAPDANADSLQQQFNTLADSLMADEILVSFGDASMAGLDFVFQPIRSIYLFSDLDFELGTNTNPVYVFIFFMVAIFILVVTAVNFVNLTIARASVRFREVGVRKVFGASRSQVISRFIVESVFFSFLALFVGLVIVELLMPWFNRLFQQGATMPGYLNQLDLFWILGITLFVGLLSGSYPALFFSGIHPVHLFRNTGLLRGRGIALRGVLIMLQVLVATLVVTISLGMQRQLHLIKRADLGFDYHDLFLIERTTVLGEKTDSVMNALKQVDGIEKVVKLYNRPGENISIISFHHKGDTSNVYLLGVQYVDCRLFDALEVELLSGEPLGSDDCSDSTRVLINALGAKMLNIDSLQNEFIQTVSSGEEEPMRLDIVGITDDVYMRSLKQPLRPTIYVPVTGNEPSQNLLVRVSNERRHEVKELTQPVWEQFVAGVPFFITPVSQRINDFYREDIRYSRVASVFSVLALFVALLGLIGMVSFILEFKKREMVLLNLSGVPRYSLFYRVFKGFFAWVMAGVILSLPLSVFILNMWLAGYTLSSPPGGLVFFVPAILLIAIAVLTALAAGAYRLRKSLKNIRLVVQMIN